MSTSIEELQHGTELGSATRPVGDLHRTVETESAAKQGVSAYRKPYRVGLVTDWGVDTPPLVDMYDAIRMGLDEALAAGIIDRPVDLRIREVEGLPYGEFKPLLDAWHDLVNEGCIMMVGPYQSENVLAIKPYVAAARVPTLSMPGSLDWGEGTYEFGLNNGTFADEATIMATFLAQQGATRVGVLHEDNALGDEYFQFFRHAAKRLGLVILDEVTTWYNSVDEARGSLEIVRAAGADGLAYMGWGSPGAPNTMNALYAMDWRPPRILSSVYMGAIRGMGYGFEEMPDDVWEGWHGIEQFDETNPVFDAMLNRFNDRFGRRPVHCYTGIGWDIGMVIANGIALARPKAPQGILNGLNKIRMLPAANCGAGTVISFAAGDHRGYKGADYIVVRTMENGMNRKAGSTHPGVRRSP